jgi:hypothetical protein
MPFSKDVILHKTPTNLFFSFYFYFYIFPPMITTMYHAKKEASNSKSDRAYWNWHVIFLNAPYIAKDWFRFIMCPPKCSQRSFLTKCYTWHCNIHFLTPYYSPNGWYWFNSWGWSNIDKIVSSALKHNLWWKHIWVSIWIDENTFLQS